MLLYMEVLKNSWLTKKPSKNLFDHLSKFCEVRQAYHHPFIYPYKCVCVCESSIIWKVKLQTKRLAFIFSLAHFPYLI